MLVAIEKQFKLNIKIKQNVKISTKRASIIKYFQKKSNNRSILILGMVALILVKTQKKNNMNSIIFNTQVLTFNRFSKLK